MQWHELATESVRGLTEAFSRSHISLTIADMNLPDAPLVGVNDKFCTMTGYSADQTLGRNCRFLQPPGGAGPVRARMREFLKSPDIDQEKFVVPNIRRDGLEFLNLVYMTKLRSDDGAHFVLGSQFDISSSSASAVDLYDTALRQDVKNISKLAGEYGLVIFGTLDSLASSHAIIAKARFDQQGAE